MFGKVVAGHRMLGGLQQPPIVISGYHACSRIRACRSWPWRPPTTAGHCGRGDGPTALACGRRHRQGHPGQSPPPSRLHSARRAYTPRGSPPGSPRSDTDPALHTAHKGDGAYRPPSGTDPLPQAEQDVCHGYVRQRCPSQRVWPCFFGRRARFFPHAVVRPGSRTRARAHAALWPLASAHTLPLSTRSASQVPRDRPDHDCRDERCGPALPRSPCLPHTPLVRSLLC
jgi:hypothetical protein